MDKKFKHIYDRIMSDENKANVINLTKYKKVAFAESSINGIFMEENLKIKCEYNKPFPSMGYISVRGKKMTIFDTEWASKVFELADNIDICPLTSGDTEFILTFHGLTNKI